MTDNKPLLSSCDKTDENNGNIIRRATKGKLRMNSVEEKNIKRVKHNSESSNGRNSYPSRNPLELETDPEILQRRQKQIDYGKNTVGYYNYTTHVPIAERTNKHPRTPDKYAKYSRRSWDKLIKIWRKKLHEYDTGEGTNDAGEDSNDAVEDAKDAGEDTNDTVEDH